VARSAAHRSRVLLRTSFGPSPLGPTPSSQVQSDSQANMSDSQVLMQQHDSLELIQARQKPADPHQSRTGSNYWHLPQSNRHFSNCRHSSVPQTHKTPRKSISAPFRGRFGRGDGADSGNRQATYCRLTPLNPFTPRHPRHQKKTLTPSTPGHPAESPAIPIAGEESRDTVLPSNGYIQSPVPAVSIHLYKSF
jgi:hypothetical protein